MKVFKFGGASVKDAKAVRNVQSVLSLYNDDSLLVVISAMGKTTNALELVWRAWQSGLNAAMQLQDSIEYYRLIPKGKKGFLTFWKDKINISDKISKKRNKISKKEYLELLKIRNRGI
jgi:aspartokinase